MWRCGRSASRHSLLRRSKKRLHTQAPVDCPPVLGKAKHGWPRALLPRTVITKATSITEELPFLRPLRAGARRVSPSTWSPRDTGGAGQTPQAAAGQACPGLSRQLDSGKTGVPSQAADHDAAPQGGGKSEEQTPSRKGLAPNSVPCAGDTGTTEQLPGKQDLLASGARGGQRAGAAPCF